MKIINICIITSLLLVYCQNSNHQKFLKKIDTSKDVKSAEPKVDQHLNSCEIISSEIMLNFKINESLAFETIKRMNPKLIETKTTKNKHFPEENDTVLIYKLFNSSFQYFKGENVFLINAELTDTIFNLGNLKIGMLQSDFLKMIKINSIKHCEIIKIKDEETESEIDIFMHNKKINSIKIIQYYD